MHESTARKPRIIKTPVHKIPIGVPFRSKDGRYGLRIKKPQSQEYEEIELEQLFEMVVKQAQTTDPQVPRPEGTAN